MITYWLVNSHDVHYYSSCDLFIEFGVIELGYYCSVVYFKIVDFFGPLTCSLSSMLMSLALHSPSYFSFPYTFGGNVFVTQEFETLQHMMQVMRGVQIEHKYIGVLGFKLFLCNFCTRKHNWNWENSISIWNQTHRIGHCSVAGSL